MTTRYNRARTMAQLAYKHRTRTAADWMDRIIGAFAIGALLGFVLGKVIA